MPKNVFKFKLSNSVGPAFACEGQQGYVPGAFHGNCQRTLMAGTCTSLASWADAAIFGDKAAKHVCLFVVDRNAFVCAKLADLGSGDKTAGSGSGKALVFAKIFF